MREPAPHKDDDDRKRDGLAVLQTFLSNYDTSSVDAAYDGITRDLGGLGEYTFKYAFGEVWSRSGPSARDRSFVQIAILAALGSGPRCASIFPTPPSIGGHPRGGGGDHGAACVYGGIARALVGRNVAPAVLAPPGS